MNRSIFLEYTNIHNTFKFQFITQPGFSTHQAPTRSSNTKRPNQIFPYFRKITNHQKI